MEKTLDKFFEVVHGMMTSIIAEVPFEDLTIQVIPTVTMAFELF
jgi:hypothetical protein